MAPTASSQLLRKLASTLREPDDLSIWRYAIARPHRDMTWEHYAAEFNITEKITCAKEDGTWSDVVSRFLEKAANGEVPISAFLSRDGRNWLKEMATQLSRRQT